MKIKIEDIKQIVEEVVQDAISEQEPPADPEPAQPAAKQAADVDVVTKYIQKINNEKEYIQLLQKVLAHVPAGDKAIQNRAVKKVFQGLQLAASGVKKVTGV
jgi:hypothetical protein